MGDEIALYLSYLQNEKHAAANTVKSYERDLKHFTDYLEETGINDISRVTRTCLNSYLLSLEREGKANSSISRMLASLRSFFQYEFNSGRISKNPTEMLSGPKVERKEPVILTEKEVDLLLAAPSGNSSKEIRDRAMLGLMYDTGVSVSELVGLRMDDINSSLGYIRVSEGGKERAISYGKKAGKALKEYLRTARPKLLRGNVSDRVFLNCSGNSISRQGMWKIVKHYSGRAGLGADITPCCLKHSSEVHNRSGKKTGDKK